MRRIMTITELAQILMTTPASIRNQLSRGREGISVPPSMRLGGRRVWHVEMVDAWLRKRAGLDIDPGQPPRPAPQHPGQTPRRGPGRPKK